MPSSLPTADRRLTDLRHIERPFTLPAFKTRRDWLTRADFVRRDVRLALGLWPEPPRGDLRPVVSKRIERDGYSIENVRFESHPGFFVTGNLYRPHPLKAGKRHVPVLLVPHGHWKEGRLVNRGPADDSMPGLCINVARRGGLAFSYDMIGYNDSCQLNHQFGKDDVEKLALYGISLMGLQTFNSIRALDYLLSLPEVDPERVAVTGASGGGTQTFALTAVDDRVKACAPAVMVSGIMQGGCLCENAPGLRMDTTSIEIAALAAPRPQLLISCTGDWTSNTPWLEFPAIRKVYALFGKDAERRIENYHQQAGHQYNRNSREALYGWLGRVWFKITDPAYAEEKHFTVEPLDELRNFPNRKPPAGTADEAAVVAHIKERAATWLEGLRPKDQAGLKRLHAEAGSLLAQSLRASQPAAKEVLSKEQPWTSFDLGKPQYAKLTRLWLSRKGQDDLLHGVLALPEKTKQKMPLAILVHNKGSWAVFDLAKGQPGELAAALLNKGFAVLGLDTFEANALFGKRPRVKYHDLAYNASGFSHRVQDILTAIAWAKGQKRFSSVDLAGLSFSGSATLAARSQAQGVRRTVIDCNGFKGDDDAYFWEALAVGIRLAGGLPMAAALCMPGHLVLAGTQGHFDISWAQTAGFAAKSDARLELHEKPPTHEQIVAWLSEPGGHAWRDLHPPLIKPAAHTQPN